ncbi:uncharacterized protein B0H18DRAFT_884055 [Fomitopsis serialis]|uniref:uncharacterized protein n=1 Tax=Fomitopsis serialis TaxID=139415 RepID=UPI002008BF7F|nr:uncharacterized protein B0H18DRAFT_884055 [Neoantrodia serialis]KAH9917199.1 hypothetical protein B0H18DRAFT_884055 [Neoantrodia serialis]
MLGRSCGAVAVSLYTYLHSAVYDPCSLTFVAYSSYCRTNDGATRIVLDHLLHNQTSGFDALIGSSGASVELVVQLTETRIAIGDLIPLVKHSHLERRAELHSLLEKLADDAKDTSRYLQQLSARIDSGADRYVGAFEVDVHVCVAQPVDPYVVLSAYEMALGTVEDVLRNLVISAQAALGKLDALDSRLQAIADVTFSETAVVSEDREHVLRQLWTYLGGNQQKIHQFERDADVLRDVEAYRNAAVAHVGMILNTLENMQTVAEETRRIASGALLRGKIPDELVLHVISDGTGRMKARRVEVAIPNLEN